MLRAGVVACLVVVALASTELIDIDKEWDLFKKEYNKVYPEEEEESYRRFVWQNHLKLVQSHNLEADRGLHTYWLGMNEYADMPNEEFVRVMNGFRMNETRAANEMYEPPSNVESMAAVVDWRTKGYVTPVKNQGGCGSCWAFSAVGSLEGQNAKKTRRLVSLSEQNLVDCDKMGSNGCRGGQMDSAFRYVAKNRGIDTETCYPYRGKDGTCHFNRNCVGGTDVSYRDIPRGSESALQSAVATVGPISVAIDASHVSFQLYRGGVYNEPACSSTRLDHGVLVVGYGSGYWLIKNSWGTRWGNAGYMQMAKGRNMCGVATQASYPVV